MNASSSQDISELIDVLHEALRQKHQHGHVTRIDISDDYLKSYMDHVHAYHLFPYFIHLDLQNILERCAKIRQMESEAWAYALRYAIEMESRQHIDLLIGHDTLKYCIKKIDHISDFEHVMTHLIQMTRIDMVPLLQHHYDHLVAQYEESEGRRWAQVRDHPFSIGINILAGSDLEWPQLIDIMASWKNHGLDLNQRIVTSYPHMLNANWSTYDTSILEQLYDLGVNPMKGKNHIGFSNTMDYLLNKGRKSQQDQFEMWKSFLAKLELKQGLDCKHNNQSYKEKKIYKI